MCVKSFLFFFLVHISLFRMVVLFARSACHAVSVLQPQSSCLGTVMLMASSTSADERAKCFDIAMLPR